MNLSQPKLLPAELHTIASFKVLAAGQLLFARHEPADAVFILEAGQIQLLNYTEDGQQVNHYNVKAGESFAEVALFNEQYVCTAIAHMPSRVWILPKQAFLNTLRQHPDLAASFLEKLARRLYESKLLFMTHHQLSNSELWICRTFTLLNRMIVFWSSWRR